MKVKEESEKAGLKLNIQKMKIMAFGHITSWQIDGEKMETVTDYILGGFKITAKKQWETLFSWSPKSLLTETAAMKLKDTCSSEGKQWQT